MKKQNKKFKETKITKGSGYSRAYKPFITKHHKESNADGRAMGVQSLPATAGAQARQRINQKGLSTDPVIMPWGGDVSDAKVEQIITQIERSQKFHGGMTGSGGFFSIASGPKPKGSKKGKKSDFGHLGDVNL